MTSSLFSIHGRDIYYEISGQGQPLLLLHGFTGSSANWKLFGHEWTEGFQTLAVDLRGHGRSTNPTGQYTHREVAEDLIALLDHLKLQKVSGVGVSSGGNILLLMATFYPERIRSIVTVSATHSFPDQARPLMKLANFDTIPADQLEELRKIHPRGDSQIRALYQQALGFATSYEDLNLKNSDLTQIQADVLVVQGDRDPLYPVEQSIEIFRSIPRSSLWIVPNEGHGPILGEYLGEFTKTARKFLKKTTPSQ